MARSWEPIQKGGARELKHTSFRCVQDLAQAGAAATVHHLQLDSDCLQYPLWQYLDKLSLV